MDLEQPDAGGSILSLLSVGSIASVLSVGSIGSLASVGSIASIGSVGSIASIGKVGAVLNYPVSERAVRWAWSAWQTRGRGATEQR